MSRLVLRRFERVHLPLVKGWFLDADTQRWLGGPDWPREMLDLADRPLTEFRGKTQTGRYRWLAWDPHRPVGYIDCGTFDRFVEWEGRPGGRGVIDTIPVPTATLGYVVDPTLRRRGYGTALLNTLATVPDLTDIRLFVAGVEPANVGSVGCLLRADYRPLNAKARLGRHGVLRTLADCPPRPGWTGRSIDVAGEASKRRSVLNRALASCVGNGRRASFAAR